MTRRIPDRLFPHQATITPKIADGATGPIFGTARPPERAQFSGSGSLIARVVAVGGVDRIVTGQVYLDDQPLEVGSRVLSSLDGSSSIVAAVRRYSGGGAAFLVVTLAQ